MSEVFTNNAREKALLQGPKALQFIKTLHELYCLLYCLLQLLLIQSNYIFSPEVLLKTVARKNNKKIIYVLMVISTMVTTMMMKYLPQHQ